MVLEHAVLDRRFSRSSLCRSLKKTQKGRGTLYVDTNGLICHQGYNTERNEGESNHTTPRKITQYKRMGSCWLTDYTKVWRKPSIGKVDLPWKLSHHHITHAADKCIIKTHTTSNKTNYHKENNSLLEYITLLQKHLTLFFFCANLVDFNEVHLHEATMNLHMYAWIFSYLSISSVNRKQHLSEVEFSVLVEFSL